MVTTGDICLVSDKYKTNELILSLFLFDRRDSRPHLPGSSSLQSPWRPVGGFRASSKGGGVDLSS